jgi:hypothetical protein
MTTVKMRICFIGLFTFSSFNWLCLDAAESQGSAKTAPEATDNRSIKVRRFSFERISSGFNYHGNKFNEIVWKRMMNWEIMND